MLDAVKENFDEQPESVLADAGYCNERDLLEARGIDGYVATGREGKKAACRGDAPGDVPHGGEAGHPCRTEALCGAQVAVRPTGKEVLGFRRFSVRGWAKARGEWDLVCLALNVKRLQPLLAG